ncbi:MAG: hypothetical protein KC766_36075, partial [Myxococcales bacterium]|nr:hypothetical protein [Myxococcales bacterium]
PRVEQVLLRAAERASVPIIKRVAVAEDVLLEIPYGMCERLLAVPIRRDSRTQTVDVATADPLDPHVAREFSYQLGVPVRVLQASVSELVRALKGISRGTPHSERTPAFGTQVARPERVIAPVHRARIPDLGPPPGTPVPQTRDYAQPRPPSDAAIPLVRRSRSSLNPPPAPAPASEEQVAAHDEQVLTLLMQSVSADEVVLHLTRGFEALSPRVVVLAVRASEYVGRAAARSMGELALNDLRIPTDKPSVVATACEAGYYLGELPQTPVHAELGQLLNQPLGEVLVQPVRVGARVALVVVSTLTQDSGRITRRAELFVRAAGEALERILMDRKLRT